MYMCSVYNCLIIVSETFTESGTKVAIDDHLLKKAHRKVEIEMTEVQNFISTLMGPFAV